ncbi:MAG: TIGR03905 family TSCPD domain-containing protein [Eubacteriales bacterium]
MTYTHKNKGTCSTQVTVSVDDSGIIESVDFTGGCDGNVKGLGNLLQGMSADEAIKRLEGIRCGRKSTSCPDQLAKALKELKEIAITQKVSQ